MIVLTWRGQRLLSRKKLLLLGLCGGKHDYENIARTLHLAGHLRRAFSS